MDTVKATKSAIGAAQRIPSNPNKVGRNRANGIKNNTCRVKDKIIPLYALPMALKNPEASI